MIAMLLNKVETLKLFSTSVIHSVQTVLTRTTIMQCDLRRIGHFRPQYYAPSCPYYVPPPTTTLSILTARMVNTRRHRADTGELVNQNATVRSRTLRRCSKARLCQQRCCTHFKPTFIFPPAFLRERSSL